MHVLHNKSITAPFHEFILVSSVESQEIETSPLFVLFSIIYILTLLGKQCYYLCWIHNPHSHVYFIGQLHSWETTSLYQPVVLFNFPSWDQDHLSHAWDLYSSTSPLCATELFLPGPRIWTDMLPSAHCTPSNHNGPGKSVEPLYCFLGGVDFMVSHTCCSYLPSSILWPKCHWSLPCDLGQCWSDYVVSSPRQLWLVALSVLW